MNRLLNFILMLPWTLVAASNTGGAVTLLGPKSYDGSQLTNINGASLTNIQAPIIMNNVPGDAFASMLQGTSDHIGQLGISFGGATLNSVGYLWDAQNVGTGSNAWSGIIGFPAGIGDIGDKTRMPSGQQNTLSITVNGNSEDSRWSHRSNRAGSYMYHYNMNPFTDGNFIYFPLITTNGSLMNGGLAGGYFTNIDGVVIGPRDIFGIGIGSIPYEYYIGETNQAGSFQLIMGVSPTPFYISYNGQFGGEPTAGQHSWVEFEQSPGRYRVNFMDLVPGSYSHTNANNVDLMVIDQVAHCVVIGNDVRGGNANAFNVVTNMYWCATDNGSVATFDYVGSWRLGFISQIGQYTKLAHTVGSPMIFGESSGSDLHTGIAGQTVTSELTIQNRTVTLGDPINLTVGITNDNGGQAPITLTPFPATTVNWTNTSKHGIEVMVNNSGVTGTATSVNGTAVYGTLVGDVTLLLKPNDYFSETYTVSTPTAKYIPFP